ncbi:hypothetical protein BgiBS90_001380, partial [Biomphalaria glabrata]
WVSKCILYDPLSLGSNFGLSFRTLEFRSGLNAVMAGNRNRLDRCSNRIHVQIML